MVTSSKQLIFCIVFMLTIFCGCKADTKVLKSFRVYPGAALRDETISLDNENELIIKGTYQEEYNIPQDAEHILKATVDYVADKNGYRAKYNFAKEPMRAPFVLHLSTASLKSLAG